MLWAERCSVEQHDKYSLNLWVASQEAETGISRIRHMGVGDKKLSKLGVNRSVKEITHMALPVNFPLLRLGEEASH